MSARIKATCLVLMLALGCGPEPRPIDWSERTRYPGARGVVTKIDSESVEIDGSTSYKIRPDVQSFSTYNGRVTPLLAWIRKYVHLGLDDAKRVEWIAGIGVVDDASTPAKVLYIGATLARVDSRRRAIFEDGTVLELGGDQDPPKPGDRVRATIDPSTDQVVEIGSL